MKGKIITGIFAVLMVGYLMLADRFQDSKKFNKASNIIAYVLMIAWYVVLFGGALFGIVMLLLHFVFKAI